MYIRNVFWLWLDQLYHLVVMEWKIDRKWKKKDFENEQKQKHKQKTYEKMWNEIALIFACACIIESHTHHFTVSSNWFDYGNGWSESEKERTCKCYKHITVKGHVNDECYAVMAVFLSIIFIYFFCYILKMLYVTDQFVL